MDGSYNIKRVILIRFFKWLYYSDISNPKQRSELSVSERKPECIQGIARLKRKEVSCYKPFDLWSQEDDLSIGAITPYLVIQVADRMNC